MPGVVRVVQVQGRTERCGCGISQTLAQHSLNIGHLGAVTKVWQPRVSNNGIDFGLSLCENLGMSNHGENKVGNSRSSLEITTVFENRTDGRGLEERERTVSMLPVYIEFVVHLRSKSSCWVMFSLLSNASEVNDGVAVPFFCTARGVSTREVRKTVAN